MGYTDPDGRYAGWLSSRFVVPGVSILVLLDSRPFLGECLRLFFGAVAFSLLLFSLL